MYKNEVVLNYNINEKIHGTTFLYANQAVIYMYVLIAVHSRSYLRFNRFVI